MPEHTVELAIKGVIADGHLAALGDCGGDGATVTTRGDVSFVAFTTRAATVLDAIVAAIAAVDAIDGLEVVHAGPDDLVGTSEIAERTGRTRQSVDLLIKGQRGPGGFPSPADHATRNALWRWTEVETWFAGYEGRPPDTERSVVLGAINGALQARHFLRGAQKAAALRTAVEELLSPGARWRGRGAERDRTVPAPRRTDYRAGEIPVHLL